jgi:YD repeat-containing protein
VVRTHAGAPTTADWFDVLGRTVKHAERGFRETDFIETYTVYDTMGTVDTQSGPFYQAQGNAGLTAWNYDALGRPTTKQSPGGELDSVHGDVVTQYAYAGSMTTIAIDRVTTSPLTSSRAQ